MILDPLKYSKVYKSQKKASLPVPAQTSGQPWANYLSQSFFSSRK